MTTADRNDQPTAPPQKFVAVDKEVKQGRDHTVARAESHTMAKRIAYALNRHKPNAKGY